MDPGPLRDLVTVLAGIATGFLSAAFGVGGAVVSTPAIRAIGVSATLAIGSTLPSILPSAVTGTLRYTRERLVDWRAVKLTAPVGIVASVGGSLLTRVVPGDGHLLMILTALLLAFTAVRMSRQRRPVRDPEEAEPADAAATAPPDRAAARGAAPAAAPAPAAASPTALLSVGAAAGLMSGLLGIGGGVVMVPGFTEVARLPVKRAIATSLVCVGIFAVPGTITHAFLGNIAWSVALALAIGVVPGARLGAAAAIRTTDDRLRLAVALFLGAISVVYFTGELVALLA